MFDTGQGPSRVPGFYTAIDGRVYYLPSVRLAMRQHMPGVPDIFFDQKDDKSWVLQVTFELIKPPGLPDGAQLLASSFSGGVDPGLRPQTFPSSFWTAGPQSLAFASPTMPLAAEGRASDVALVLRTETPVDPNQGLALLRQYPNAYFALNAFIRLRFRAPGLLDGSPPGSPGTHIGPAAAHPQLLTPPGAPQIGACFPSDLPANRPIYTLILGNADATNAMWTRETGSSWTRAAAGLDRYDVLPDSFALAIEPNTGLPAMSVLLVQNPPASAGASATYTVRVRFGVAPQLDDARLDAVRASLRSTHAIPYASLGIGDYGTATFTPSGLFADLPGFQSTTSGGDPATGGSRPVDAACGFELVLDCSLEFYTLLTGVLKSPEGLRGTVRFQIVIGHGAADTTLVDVPVRLALTGTMEVGLTTEIGRPSGAGASRLNAWITNPLDVPVTVGAVRPTFLLMDKRPDLVSLATPGTAVPAGLTLAPKDTAIVTVSGPDPAALPPFTSLVFSFAEMHAAFDPDAVLNRVHALAAATGASTTLHLSCYLLRHADQIPPALAGLIGVKVQVKRRDGPALDMPLTRDKPEGDLVLPYSLADLLAGASLDQPSITYRIASVFPDHTGPWTDWLPNTGCDLLVTPATA